MQQQQHSSPEAVADVIRKLPVESLRRIIDLVSLKDEGVRELVRWCSVVVCDASGHNHHTTTARSLDNTFG